MGYACKRKSGVVMWGAAEEKRMHDRKAINNYDREEWCV